MAADREELERPERESVRVELVARGVADEHGALPQRGRSQPLRPLEPVRRPLHCEGPGRAVVAVSIADLLERRQEDLLDGALDRTERQRRLHRRVRPVELEGVQCPRQRAGVSAQRLARAADCGGDGQPLLQRVAEGRDLAVRVEPVLARRALRLGVAETTLPRTERVGADVQYGSRFGGLQRAHR